MIKSNITAAPRRGFYATGRHEDMARALESS